MTDPLSSLNFADDLAEVLSCEDATRWTIKQVVDLEVWVTLSPVDRPEEVYQARLLWAAYPDRPPSLKFRDPVSGRLDLASAWPTGGPFRPTSFLACVNYTIEGFQLHSDWSNDARYRWDSRGNVLLKVIRLLQDDLDLYYQGRHPA